MMSLEVLAPTEVVLREEGVEQVVAESPRGSFCLRPRHVDFVDLVTPSLLHYRREGRDYSLAVDEGVLVKRGRQVTVATRRAVAGRPLEELAGEVGRMLQRGEEHERDARDALASLEANLVRRFLEPDRD